MVGKNPPRGVGQINGPLHPVAEYKLLGETDRGLPYREDTVPGTNFFDDGALIMIGDLRLDTLHHLRGADIDSAITSAG